MKNLAHSASLESLDKNAPSKTGTKHLDRALAAKDTNRAALAQGLAGPGGTGASDANRGARLPMNGGYWQAFGLKKQARVACHP
jgi:hypothetical protein